MFWIDIIIIILIELVPRFRDVSTDARVRTQIAEEGSRIMKK